MTPRPYQAEALDALDDHLRTKDSNPCVVIPTGGGKSAIIAWAIKRWKEGFPPFRCIILAHRKELVEQNAAELAGFMPGASVGIYSAGLRKRDIDADITYAHIDSVHSRAGEFPPVDCLLVDEAHRIPPGGEGKYRRFINDCQAFNPRLKVVGFTATPYRMGGPICHADHILNEVCYEANVADLIRDGYLCKLRSRPGDVQADLTDVRRNNRGDYIVKSLAEAVDTPEIVAKAVKSAVEHINAENRRSIVFFCVDVKHCTDVSQELRRYGIDAPCVTGKTPHQKRDRIAEDFKSGRYRAICNVNVYTEGFNAKRVDCVVLLRPTLSKGLFCQMVGRGLRLHPQKSDCLILDYGRCIETHGPIDCTDAGQVRMVACAECTDVFSRQVRQCPGCGWIIPPQEIERLEQEEEAERVKQMHDAEIAQRAILGSEPEVLQVSAVSVARHRKQGKPDSIRVQYRCGGIATFREWVCLEHGGPAERAARQWWAQRFGVAEARAITVEDALDLLLADRIKEVTESITVRRKGKYTEIINHKIKGTA